MKTYIRYILNTYIKSFFYVMLIILSLVIIINLLGELDFFKNINVSIFFTIYLSLLNAPSVIFEIFPFIFLISTQLFYIRLFNNDEIQIFKYSGLKNSKILLIITVTSLLFGLIIISLFYNLSSNLKNFYLEIKSNYTTDGKYLAVINKNGLWIRDKIDNKIYIINASEINDNFLIDSFITEFDENYNVVRNIKSEKIDITKNKWLIIKPEIFLKNNSEKKDEINLLTSFNYKRIQSLFSNLSSLSFLKLIELKKNYNLLNYSVVDVNIQIQKLLSYPIYLILMTIFSSTIMLNTKKFKSNTLKISLGLFLCVIIYYFSNLFNVLGKTEKIHYMLSVWAPLLFLSLIILLMTHRVNEK
jgi:lipopolysaccharide export system permease protein